MNEFKIINKYFSSLAKLNKGSFNLTDDIFFDKDKKIGISIDTYVEGTHFFNFKKPDLVFKKALRSSISDLVCKGISPKYYFISFTANKNNLSKKNILKIQTSLKSEQKKFNIILSGGDIVHSKKVSITITSIGYSKKFPVLRRGAKINDDIYVTNNIGDSYVGLNLLKKKINMNKKNSNYFIKKFYLPKIPHQFSKKLVFFANSSIDISDGLFQDLEHILRNSKLSSNLFIKKIPISKYLKAYLKKTNQNIMHFISKGDDHQILFTASKNKRNLIKKFSKIHSTKVTLIGVTKKKSISKSINLVNGNFILPKKLGYMHNFS